MTSSDRDISADTANIVTPQEPQADWPLCVDLDGTLTVTDTFHEALLISLKRNPLCIFPLFLWLLRGRAFVKRKLAQSVQIRVDLLPYHEEMLAYLREEYDSGRRLLLVTGADSSIARKVADHLGIFDTVLSSDGVINLVGRRKVEGIRQALGGKPFLYAGNSRSDLVVWEAAAGAIAVNASPGCLRQLRRGVVPLVKVFNASRADRAVIGALRPHQWAKNVLVFLPIALSHKLMDTRVLEHGLFAFVAFSLTASALYVVNDLLDLDADRQHQKKRFRPFASGAVSISGGVFMAVLLLAGGAVITAWLGREAQALLAVYVVMTLAYSLRLKQFLLVDVVMLMGFYNLRVLFGGAATGIVISMWTLAFSMFMFISLALVKRLSELRLMQNVDRESQSLTSRGYLLADIPLVSSMGVASGYIAALVMALYINGPETSQLYSHPQYLWLTCPLLIYWLSRVWILANRGTMNNDPVLFALTDRGSLATGVALAVIIVSAT